MPAVAELAAQETATLVTFAEPIVPEPFATEQVCPAGLVFTVTAYAAPPASAVANVNAAVGGDAQVVTAVVLQHHRPRQPRHSPADRSTWRSLRAGDGHVGDVGRADRARAVGNRAGLPGRVGLHRHGVGRPAGQRGRERERRRWR